MSKIQLTDTTIDVVSKMSEGNPGAMTALMEILSKGEKIDPDGMGGLGPILMLDTLEIYGTDIYVFFSDLCNRDVAKTIAVIRAVQFGFFSGETLASACSFQDYSGREMVPVDELYEKVKERLPNFNAVTA